jgi:hypothetical protein
MRKIIMLLLLILVIATKLSAETFKASVDKNVVELGDRIVLTYSIDGDGSNFRAPRFNDFKIVGGPSQSNNIQIINGKMSRQFSITYVLEATKEGKFTLPSATISSNGKDLTSNTVQISVVKPSQARIDQMKKEKEQNQNLEAQARDIINKNLKVTVNVDKTSIYVGEPVVATYKLYLHPQLNILQLTNDKVPQLNGFWNQDINLGEIKYGLEEINGTAYRTATIKKVILFPQQSGNLKVDSYSFNATVRLQIQNQKRQRSRDPFADFFDDFFSDPFFNNSYKDFNTIVTSPTIDIKVKPLPNPTPVGFTNAVGNYTINSWLDKTQAKTGEAVTYKIKISGRGNLKLLSPPELNLPSNLEVYEPKTIDNTKITESNIEGDIIFEYVIIPQTTGEYKIPSLPFSFFDLSNKQFKTLNTADLTLKVIQGDQQTFSSSANKTDLQLLNQDIDYIKTELGSNYSNTSFTQSLTFYILYFIPIVLLILFILWRKKQEQQNQNQTAYRKQKAKKIVQKRLELSRQYLQQNDVKKFVEELNHAIWGFLSDKFSIESSKLTREKIEEVLISKGADEQIRKDVIELIDKCEFAHYAPTSIEGNMNSLYEFTESVISGLEEKIK